MKTKLSRLISIRTLVILSVAMGLGLFQNCSQAKFSAGASDQGSNGYNDQWRDGLDQPNLNPGSCYNVLHQLATDAKVVFVVDNSGSNTSTDPMKTMRAGSIEAFFNDFKSKQNFWYGFITFKGVGASALINNGNSSQPTITNLLPPMQSAIATFKAAADNGNTPYKAATDMAMLALQNDTNVNANTKWIVVFLSDGQPTPMRTDEQLKADVEGLLAVKPGKVSFNTIYYGSADLEATERLRMMAQVGGGKFLDTNANPSGKSFLISNVINVPGMPACQP
ncbi:MAG: VWA domain-containing protein [Bdellovibrionales bacterium]|nr:VWA domain-containing protein [Bdellovibrionales bacterium]